VIAGCPTVAQVREARKAIAGAAIRTPLVRLNTSDSPAEIYLKLENLQPIGSFKIRGAANAMAHMTADQLERGVVTASAGNMAQGVAWRARELGIPCTVIAPDTAPQTKISAIERLGGRVLKVSFDEWWRAFEERCYPGVEGTFIHAFDDLNVMAGNGTIALEILEDLPGFDAIVIPWGGGGLTCGIASVLRELKPKCKIFAAEVATAAPLLVSWKTGSPQMIEPQRSFVDGVGGKSVFHRCSKGPGVSSTGPWWPK
jgi:threonine dehydratase